MDIYWIKDKHRCGPSTVPDVISLLQIGELTPESLGWHAGCKQWLPLRELPALADFLNKKEPAMGEVDDLPAAPAEPAIQPAPPPAAEETPLQPEPSVIEQKRVFLPSPVTRMLARFVDYGLYAVLYGAVIHLQDIPYNASLLLQANPLLWLPMLVIEAAMLSTWGTTPGKALMGIRVTTFGDVPRLSFMRALLRALTVFTIGTGLMIPHILPLMLLFEYWMLRRRGITPWDARNSTLPTQEKPASPSRYTLAVISLYVSSVLVWAVYLKPWLPAMMNELAQQNPEMAESLRPFLPPDLPATTAPAPTPAAQAAPAATPAPPQPASLPGL